MKKVRAKRPKTSPPIKGTLEGGVKYGKGKFTVNEFVKKNIDKNPKLQRIGLLAQKSVPTGYTDLATLVANKNALF